MENTLAHGVVEQGECRLEQRLRRGLVLGVERDAQLANLVTQLGGVRAIALRSNGGLLNAL